MRWFFGAVLCIFLLGGNMNSFVSQPLDKKMNRENIIDKIQNLEDRAGPQPSATIGNLSELSPDSGDQVAGTYYVVDQQTGAIRGYMTATPNENFPGYYLAFFDSAGVFQFGVNADTGQAVAGAGAVTLDVNGMRIKVGTSVLNLLRFINQVDDYPVADIYALASTDSKNFELHMETGDGGVGGKSVLFLDAYSVTGTPRIELHSEYGVAVYADIASLIRADVLNGIIYLNYAGLDKDTIIRGNTDDKLIVVDAGLDAVAVGGDPSSDYKLKVYGTTNLAGSPIATNLITRGATSVGQGTWAPVVNVAFPYAGYFGNTGNNGDNFTVNFWLPAGTYKLRFNAAKNTNRCIVKVEIGATNLGNTDLYMAGPDNLYVAEYTNISIATGGLYAVKFTCNGKNGSSSGYFLLMSQIEFIRTA